MAKKLPEFQLTDMKLEALSFLCNAVADIDKGAVSCEYAKGALDLAAVTGLITNDGINNLKEVVYRKQFLEMAKEKARLFEGEERDNFLYACDCFDEKGVTIQVIKVKKPNFTFKCSKGNFSAPIEMDASNKMNIELSVGAFLTLNGWNEEEEKKKAKKAKKK